MAAGLGFKTFTTGEVLTAADTNGYLMQGINVFASTAARDAAITSPQEGQFAFTKDTNGLWYYDGAAWVASGATGDIEGVTAGIGISGGGTSGTVTVTNSMATAIDAKGDLIAGTAADTFDRLAVGTNGQTLVADSSTSTGLKWATPASGSTFVGCLASSRAAQSIANNTQTAVALATEAYDTDSIHSTVTNNSRFTIPSGKTGYWLFYATSGFDPLTANNFMIRFYKNGSAVGPAIFSGNTNATTLSSASISNVLSLTAGDYVELYVYQSSGVSSNLLISGVEDFTFAGCSYLGA